jgi:hypothetical protein
VAELAREDHAPKKPDGRNLGKPTVFHSHCPHLGWPVLEKRRHVMKFSHIVGLFVVGCALVVLCPGRSSAWPGPGKKGRTAKKLEDIALAYELQKTGHLLTKADRDYQGHRAAAVRQIKHAIADLKKEAHLRGFKVGNGYKGPEPQPVSDAQLKKAIDRLQTILKQVNNLPATRLRTRAAEHIVKAIDELKIALTIA